MQRLTNTVLPVRIRFQLDDVDTILFKFKQYDTVLYFKYPSENAFRKTKDDNIVCLRWTESETWMFDDNYDVSMGTLIKLKGSDINPRTPIEKFKMDPTLFEPEELIHFD